ncbi:hypothetical protein WJX77_002380 [Trebouxia sp. C0004]
MATDEETARRLHLEMNGFAQRRRGAPTDLAKLAPARASLEIRSPSTDVQMSEAETERRGDTTNNLLDELQGQRTQDRHSPSVGVTQKPAKPAEVVMKVSQGHSCFAKAAALRAKAEKSSSTQCFYWKIPEPRKVSTPGLIDSRINLAKFVNSVFSCEKIRCQKGELLDVVFVPHDRGAASIRFPPLSLEQLANAQAAEHQNENIPEERSPEGTMWSFASKNAAFVMLTQNEGTQKNMRHPKLVH